MTKGALLRGAGSDPYPQRAPAPGPVPADGEGAAGGGVVEDRGGSQSWPVLGALALVPSVVATAAFLVRADDASVAMRLVLLLVAFAAYWVLVAVALHHPPPSVAVGAAAALLVGLAVATPPLHSGDIRSYAMYGRIVSHHRSNPHLHPPSDFRGDPLLARMNERWRDTPSVYGPAFTAISAGVMAVAGTVPERARLAFQGLAALAVAGAVALLFGRAPPALVAATACNPVLIVSVVNGGHNDALVGLAVVAGCILAAGGRHRAAAAVLALGALVKIVALLPLAAVTAWLLHTRGRAAAVAFGATSAVTVAAGYVVAGGTAALDPLRDAGLQTSRASLWDGIRRRLTQDLVADGWLGLDAGARTRERLAPLVVVAVVVLAALLVAGVLRDRGPGAAAGASLLAYLLAGAYVLPWYAGFALPVLALGRRTRLLVVAAAHTGLLLLAYLPRTGPDLDPVQRFLRDVYAVWIPLFVAIAIVVVVAAALRELASAAWSSHRRRAGGGRVRRRRQRARRPPARGR